jgi:hypothetical protein
MVGFNMAGIFCLILYSIWISKILLEMQIRLDINKDTPSDYALLVRNIPLDMTKEVLKEKFEQIFSDFNVKVFEVNYCFDVKDIVKLNKIVAKNNYLKGMCKIHDLKQSTKLKCSPTELKNHKDYVKPSKQNKFRIWRRRILDRDEIQKDLRKLLKEINDREQDLNA